MKKHPLILYLENKNLSIRKFSHENGLNYSSMLHFLNGVRFPSYRMILRIIKATNFELCAEELASWHMSRYIEKGN
jgi:predicted transcriptional regulator